jgi:hypothetical protein
MPRSGLVQQTDALNSHAFGHFGMLPAKQTLVPEAGGVQGTGDLANLYDSLSSFHCGTATSAIAYCR